MRAKPYLLAVAILALGAGAWRGLGSDARAPQRPNISREPGVASGAPGQTSAAAPAPRARVRGPRPRLPAHPGQAAPGATTGGDLRATRALVREALAQDLPRKLPALALSAADVERLGDVMLRIRAHQLRLARLAHTRENAAARRRARQRLVADLLAIEEITGTSAVELTNALSDQGLTTEEDDHAAPVLAPLPVPAR